MPLGESMAEKLALKRLAGSDLSFFDFHFRNKTYGDHRQKGINLNTDVFVDQFYPQAHALLGARWPVLTTLYGPGTASAFVPPGSPQRPITYNNGKNWRLNGGTIPDDPALPDRWQPLAPGDLALLRFRRDPVPDEVDLILIARGLPADAAAHALLDPLVPRGRRTMIPVTASQMAAVLADLALPDDHPLAGLEDAPEVEAAVEEVALGGLATRPLRRRRGGRRLTPAELAAARDEAERIGADGEALLNDWLAAQEAAGEITELEWRSQLDAAAPYDFRFRTSAGERVRMDAKSTTGPFERAIHMSAGEVLEAAREDRRYDLARLYDIDEDGALLRVAEDIGGIARALLDRLQLPEGVRIDSFSINPEALRWSDVMAIDRPDEEADGEE